MHASTRARFEEAYQGIADRLQLPGRQDANVDVLRLVSNWLCDEANGSWLMVVDNADNGEVFYPKPAEQNEDASATLVRLEAYLPKTRNGSLLITSRNKEVAVRLAGGYTNTREVPVMDEGQARACHALQEVYIYSHQRSPICTRKLSITRLTIESSYSNCGYHIFSTLSHIVMAMNVTSILTAQIPFSTPGIQKQSRRRFQGKEIYLVGSSPLSVISG